MRVLTFQSQEVIKKIILDGIYFADNKLCRENRDYQADINQLSGFNPIWCFASTKETNFKFDDFTDGVLLERFRCEMSLDQEVGLTRFMLLEIEVDDKDVFEGITHNAYSGAKVVPTITMEQLKAVYRVTPTTHWYYKNVRLLRSYNGDDILFPNGLQTLKRRVMNNETYELYTGGLRGRSAMQHYTLINGVMESITINKVSYSGDFYTVTTGDNKTLEVESVYSKVNITGN